MKDIFKILYIILAGIGVFFITNLLVLIGIICFHLLLYFLIKNPQKSLRFLLRIKWFVLIIFLGNAFVGENDLVLLNIEKWGWTLAMSYDGIVTGGMMCGRLISMIMITQIVRFSMPREAFIKGLSGLGLSKSSAEIIDTIMDIVGSENASAEMSQGNGKGGGNGGGKGGGNGKNNSDTAKESEQQDQAIWVVLKGRVGNIPKKLITRLEFASSKFVNNPNATIGSAALAVTLIRMVKIAPGLPIAPGHKNILSFPVFIYGIDKTKKPFAGVQIGLISGILHFSMGFGKYGALSILEFIIVGLVIDLMFKLPIKKTNLIFLMLIGALAGAAKVSFEVLMLYLFLPKDEELSAFLLILSCLPLIIMQLLFGIGSGFISKAILKNNNNEQRINS